MASPSNPDVREFRGWDPPSDFIVRVALLEQRMAERERHDADMDQKIDALLHMLEEIKLTIERNKSFTAGVAAAITLVISIFTYYWDRFFHPGGSE